MVATQRVETRMHSGPLPDPQTLEQYNQILPGAADRIIGMAEREQAHRHIIQQKTLTAQFAATIAGQACAVLIGLAGVSGGIYLAAQGQPLGGFGVFFTSLAGLVGVFFYNRKDLAGHKTAADQRTSSGTKQNS